MALLDITNVPHSQQRKKNMKRLSDGTFKNYEYSTYRKQLEVLFKSESEKLVFESKLHKVKDSIGGKLSLEDILAKLMDFYLLQSELPCQQNDSFRAKQEMPSKNRSGFKDETLYIGDVVSAEEYVSLITQHSRLRQMDLQLVDGHVIILKY